MFNPHISIAIHRLPGSVISYQRIPTLRNNVRPRFGKFRCQQMPFLHGSTGYSTVLKYLHYGLPMVVISVLTNRAVRTGQLECVLTIKPEYYSRIQLRQNIDQLIETAHQSQATGKVAACLQKKYLQFQHSVRSAADVLVQRIDSYFSA